VDDAERGDRNGQPRHDRRGAGGQAGAKTPDPVGAQIAFSGKRVGFVRVGAGIGQPAETAGFLIAKPHHADRAAVRAAGLQQVCSRRCYRHAGAPSSMAPVPRSQLSRA